MYYETLRSFSEYGTPVWDPSTPISRCWVYGLPPWASSLRSPCRVDTKQLDQIFGICVETTFFKEFRIPYLENVIQDLTQIFRIGFPVIFYMD